MESLASPCVLQVWDAAMNSSVQKQVWFWWLQNILQISVIFSHPCSNLIKNTRKRNHPNPNPRILAAKAIPPVRSCLYTVLCGVSQLGLMCKNVNYKLMSNELEANLEAKVTGFVVVCWVSSMPAHAYVCVSP